VSLPTVIVEAAFSGGASTGSYLQLDDLTRGKLDTATLGPDTVWTDISAYVHRLAIDRGANRVESSILRSEAGTCTIDLNNSDRRFDPTNLSGPYVSAGVTQVTPMRAIRVRATWNGVTYDLFRGFADEWHIDYDPPRYSLCTLRCTDATKVLANYDRVAVGAVGGGEAAGARVTRILDSGSWSASDRSIATGDTTMQATTLEGPVWDELLLTQATDVGEIYIDGAGRVVYRNRQAAMEDPRSTGVQARFGDSPVPGVQTTINLVRNPSAEIDIVGWGAGGSAPPVPTQSSVRAMFGTKSVLYTWATNGLLPLASYIVTGLEFGKTYTISVYVYVPTGSPGVFLFLQTGLSFEEGIGTGTNLKDQWVRLTKTHTISPATGSTWDIQLWPLQTPTSGDQLFVDGLQVELGGSANIYCDGDQASSEWDGVAHASTSRRLPELPYQDVEIEYDDTTIANYVRITAVGGTEQVVQDVTSQQLYLIHTHSRSDLIMETDAAALDYANLILYQSKDPELRFSTLDVIPHRDETALYPQVLGREFGDRIRIVRRPPGGGTIARDVFIRGVRHEVDKRSNAWGTRWTLQSATKYAFLTLDHGTLGKLDENALAY